METRTFFSDETSYYRIPAEPDPGDIVRIRFRTGRFQADSVCLFCIEKPENGPIFIETCSRRELHMQWEEEKNNFDFYFADLELTEDPVFYVFSINTDGRTVLYDKLGASENERELMPFVLYPGYHTPDWSKGCLYYQIFPDRFYNSNKENDVRDGDYVYNGRDVIHSDWGDPILYDTYRQFYGGDLQGVSEKLTYLKELGVEAIYLNPVFASPSSHKYDCCDYEHVDMGLAAAGDEEASDEVLANLIESAHALGIRIVLDGVFNHCSSAHRWFGRNRRKEDPEGKCGAYANPLSPYHDRFLFYNDECTNYEAWWGVKTLPKLNYEGDNTLTEDICRIGQKWISEPFNADGWRLDVAADLGHSKEENHRVWKEFHKAVRSVNKDTLILAEHYEDPSPWLNPQEWDGIMNYNAFMDPVSYFFTGMEKHSDAFYPELKGNAEIFEETLKFHSALFPQNALFSSLNQLDNHDHSRFLTRTGQTVGRIETHGTYAAGLHTDTSVLRQAAGFMYFWSGCPGLYYGDETGLFGFTDPDNRRCFPWDTFDKDLLWYFQALGEARSHYPFVKTASTLILYAKDGIFAYQRFTDKEALTVVVSASEEECEAELPLWMGIYPGYEQNRIIYRIIQSDKSGYSFIQKPYVMHYGVLNISIAPGELLVFG